MTNWNSTAKLNEGELDLVSHIHDYGVNLNTNEVYITPAVTDSVIGSEEPGVDHSMATRFIMNLNICRVVNPNKPLAVIMKTCGGSWEEGMAMFDAILTYPFHVTVLNYTHSRSMSSMIPLAATKCVMMPNSTFMFHEGTYCEEGTFKEVRSGVEFYHRVASQTMLDIYCQRMLQKGKYKDRSEKQIKKILNDYMNRRENVYLTARQAVEWGFYDEVFDGDWDRLTQYTKEQIHDAAVYCQHFLESKDGD